MVTIKVEKDYSCDMARVFDTMGNGMEGNFWDFHPECHDIWKFEDFTSADELALRIKEHHTKNGRKATIVNGSYVYS